MTPESEGDLVICYLSVAFIFKRFAHVSLYSSDPSYFIGLGLNEPTVWHTVAVYDAIAKTGEAFFEFSFIWIIWVKVVF
jgi:hypothetical protein